MGGPISSLLDISRRSLFNNSSALRVIGNNIANVNTEGYSRREIELVDVTTANASDTSFGLGANVKDVIRRVDNFVNKQLLGNINDRAKAGVRDELLGRVEDPFSVDKTLRHIGSDLSDFFSALNDVQANPADIPLRTKIIEAGQNLTQSIRLTWNTISSLQREADNRIRSAIEDVNAITQKIAEFNQQIATSEGGGVQNLGLRDQRDQLLRNLAEKVSFHSVEDDHGYVSVYLSNGFALVNGNSYKQLQGSTTFPSPLPNGLDNSKLTNIVWDADSSAGTSYVDLTQIFAAGSGEIAGLLNFRGVQRTTNSNIFQATGDIPQIAARVDSISMDLILRFNETYRPNPAGINGASGDLDGNDPGMYSLFNVRNAAGGPAISNDANTNNIHDIPDLNAAGLGNFSADIYFVPTDPARLALSLDPNGTTGGLAFAPGDSGIATRLANLQTQSTMYSKGNFSASTTIEDLYNQTVTYVGSLKSRSASELTAAQQREAQMQEIYTGISGVNLDEELSKLINFQRAFQASSRLIKVGDELLQDLLSQLT